YLIFSEFRGLDNTSIARYLNAADTIDSIKDSTVRANALGMFQAEVGLWQIFARQGQIPANRLNDSWQRTIAPFARQLNARDLFIAGRNSLREILRDAAGTPELSQAGIALLLAGPVQQNPDDEKVRQDIARRISSVVLAQRLVSLDTLLSLSDAL